MYPGQMYTPHPGHQTQFSRALLHPYQFDMWKKQVYPGQIYTPTNFFLVEKTSVKQSIKHEVCSEKADVPPTH